MSDHIELDRRNYALTTETLDMENFLQISCAGETLATVCSPQGRGEFFAVFNGNGLDDEDNDLHEKDAVKLFSTAADDADAWRQAVRYGYLHALGKMMTADKREENNPLTEALRNIFAA